MELFIEIIMVTFAYLLGAIPFGYILTKRVTGMNITKLGSGNIGSTNVARIAGKKISLLTQLFDMGKGLVPVAISLMLQRNSSHSLKEYTVCLVALSAIIGHNYSIFLKLKGGKGVNTTLGASLLLTPAPVFLSVVVYLLVKNFTKYVSVGSVSIAITLPLACYILQDDPPLLYYLLVCGGMILINHISNIRRLLAGRENKSPSSL